METMAEVENMKRPKKEEFTEECAQCDGTGEDRDILSGDMVCCPMCRGAKKFYDVSAYLEALEAWADYIQSSMGPWGDH